MTPARFRSLLDRYGANPGDWPDTDLEAAQALLTTSPEACHDFARAGRLDRLIQSAALPPPKPTDLARLVDTVAAAAAATPQFPPRLSHWRPQGTGVGFGPTLVLASIAAVLGIMIGHAAIDTAGRSSGPTLSSLIAAGLHQSSNFGL